MDLPIVSIPKVDHDNLVSKSAKARSPECPLMAYDCSYEWPKSIVCIVHLGMICQSNILQTNTDPLSANLRDALYQGGIPPETLEVLHRN